MLDRAYAKVSKFQTTKQRVEKERLMPSTICVRRVGPKRKQEGDCDNAAGDVDLVSFTSPKSTLSLQAPPPNASPPLPSEQKKTRGRILFDRIWRVGGWAQKWLNAKNIFSKYEVLHAPKPFPRPYCRFLDIGDDDAEDYSDVVVQTCVRIWFLCKWLATTCNNDPLGMICKNCKTCTAKECIQRYPREESHTKYPQIYLTQACNWNLAPRTNFPSELMLNTERTSPPEAPAWEAEMQRRLFESPLTKSVIVKQDEFGQSSMYV